MAELESATYDRITQLSSAGNERADVGDFDGALALFSEAWDLVPEPKQDWEAATWILAAIGDVSFLKGDYAETREALQFAMHFPNAIGNPFLHLRLGQAQLELGNEERAADELMRAFMAAGHDVFADDDPKYLSFLRTWADID